MNMYSSSHSKGKQNFTVAGIVLDKKYDFSQQINDSINGMHITIVYVLVRILSGVSLARVV